MAHFLEADLQPWAAALAEALFAPDAAQQSTVLPQRKARRLASPGVRDAPAPTGSAAATAEVSSAERREGAWLCLEELRPLHGAVDAVLHAAKLPLLDQLPRTPAGWQPALIDSHVVDGKLVLSYRKAAACCDAMHAVRGVHTLTLNVDTTAEDDTEAEVIELSICTAMASLSILRTVKLFQGSGIGASFPVWPLLLALTRLTQLAELVLHCHDVEAAQGLPFCLPTTLTCLDLAITGDNDENVCKLVSGMTCLSQLTCFRYLGPVRDLEDKQVLAPALGHLTALTSLCLDSNYLGSADVEALAAALGRLSRLAALNLAENGLEEAGAAALALPIAHLTALTALELGGNAVGDAGAQALASALRHLSQLAFLRLDFDRFGLPWATSLDWWLSRCTLTVLAPPAPPRSRRPSRCSPR